MNKQDLSIPMARAGGLSLLISLPVASAFVVVFILRWGPAPVKDGFNALLGSGLLTFLAVAAVGVVAHELIHGLTWALFGRKPWRAMTFGVQWKTLTPYAHCREPMPINAYRIGALMPGILLGFLPAVAAILTGNGWLLAFGFLFITVAGGDFLIVWTLRSVGAGKYVEDHPTEAGCYVLDAYAGEGAI